MDPVHNPHDRFFKETFSRVEVARDFVAHYLPPEIAELLDPATLSISKDTFVDKELKERFSDLLYQIQFKEKGKAFVYLLFEHKSYQDPEIALYLLLLMVRIWMQYRKQDNKGPLPPILPLVVYHGEGQWRISPRFHELVELPDVVARYVPKFEYLIWDLSRYSDEEIRGGVALRVAFLLMKHIFSKDAGKRLPEIFGLLEEVMQKRTGLQYLEAALRYVLSGASHVKEEDVVRALKKIRIEEGGDLMATLAQQWIEQGIEKGIEQGIEKGIEQGSRKLLGRQIAKRFQVKPESVYSVFVGLKTEEIEELGERFLDAESLDQIREWAEEKRRGRAS
jgi:predicted transposase/invertase (TIGR01784 family)